MVRKSSHWKPEVRSLKTGSQVTGNRKSSQVTTEPFQHVRPDSLSPRVTLIPNVTSPIMALYYFE